MRWALNTMMDHFELNRQEAKGLMGCYWRGLVDVLVELPDGLTILRPEDTLNRGEQ
jgi:hypothetical protein